MWSRRILDKGLSTSPRKLKRHNPADGANTCPVPESGRPGETHESSASLTIQHSQRQRRLLHKRQMVEYRAADADNTLTVSFASSTSVIHGAGMWESTNTGHRRCYHHGAPRAQEGNLGETKANASASAIVETAICRPTDADVHNSQTLASRTVRFKGPCDQGVYDTLGRLVGCYICHTIKQDEDKDEQVNAGCDSEAINPENSGTRKLETRTDRIVRFRLPGDKAVYDTGGRVVE